jgi:hypothetical protein
VIAELESYGAAYTLERVVREDRVITSAAVSSGIDMAIGLAASLSDDTTAQAIPLYTEDDPQPLFDTGWIAKAPANVRERARNPTQSRPAPATNARRAKVRAAVPAGSPLCPLPSTHPTPGSAQLSATV